LAVRKVLVFEPFRTDPPLDQRAPTGMQADCPIGRRQRRRLYAVDGVVDLLAVRRVYQLYSTHQEQEWHTLPLPTHSPNCSRESS